jgi:hypothetical protein
MRSSAILAKSEKAMCTIVHWCEFTAFAVAVAMDSLESLAASGNADVNMSGKVRP